MPRLGGTDEVVCTQTDGGRGRNWWRTCASAVDEDKSQQNAIDEEKNSVCVRVVSVMIDFLIYSIFIFALIIGLLSPWHYILGRYRFLVTMKCDLQLDFKYFFKSCVSMQKCFSSLECEGGTYNLPCWWTNMNIYVRKKKVLSFFCADLKTSF